MSYSSKAANQARRFNSLMHIANESWAANVLGMKVNPSKGPDLITDKAITEIKFKLIYPKGYTHLSWRVLGFQLDYEEQEGKIGYWGLGKYWLSKPIEDIKTEKPEELEELVTNR